MMSDRNSAGMFLERSVSVKLQTVCSFLQRAADRPPVTCDKDTCGLLLRKSLTLFRLFF